MKYAMDSILNVQKGEAQKTAGSDILNRFFIKRTNITNVTT